MPQWAVSGADAHQLEEQERPAASDISLGGGGGIRSRFALPFPFGVMGQALDTACVIGRRQVSQLASHRGATMAPGRL